MRKVLDILFIVILILSVVLIIGRDALFVQPQQIKIQPSPTPVASSQTNPPVIYDKESNDRMLQLLKDKKPLSQSDQAAKTKLIKRTNPIHDTALYRIEYIKTFDEFLIEIRTIDIQKAKEESVAWILSQGVSKEGLCHLPVVYYLNKDTANNLRSLNIHFNPLPPGC